MEKSNTFLLERLHKIYRTFVVTWIDPQTSVTELTKGHEDFDKEDTWAPQSSTVVPQVEKIKEQLLVDQKLKVP